MGQWRGIADRTGWREHFKAFSVSAVFVAAGVPSMEVSQSQCIGFTRGDAPALESPRWKPGDQRLSGCSVSCGAVHSLPLAACCRRVRCGLHAIAKKPPMKTSGIAVEIDINRGPRASNLTDAGSGTLFFGRKMVDPCW